MVAPVWRRLHQTLSNPLFMQLRLKTKLTLGLIFLFILTLLISMQGIYQIYRLNQDARLILQENLHSIAYCNNMLMALEQRPVKLATLQQNLALQQHNITEPGEDSATARVTDLVAQIQQSPGNAEIPEELRHAILQVAEINQQAIIEKNQIASLSANRAILTLSVSTLIVLTISIIFIFAYPQIVSHPINLLTAGIRQIAEKNYSTRIHLQPGDEFGDLAEVFNLMAGKLHEYENSNLEQLRFEKTRLEAIINQMNDGIIGLDAKNRVLFMNAVAIRLCGPKKTPLLESVLKHPVHQQLIIGDTYFIKDVVNVTVNGDAIGEVIVLRDVSAFQELAAAKTRFIATASHELKTPISAMKMSLSLLADTRTGPLLNEQKELLDSINEDVERILQISTELLDAAGEAILPVPPAHPGSSDASPTQP